MTQFHVLARRVALAVAVACVFAGTVLSWPGICEAKKKPAPAQQAGPGPQGPQPGSDAAQKAAEAEAAKKAYDAGLKAYAAGRFPASIEQLSSAVKSGKLSSSELAKALFTRGLAYKKDNKPGLAISDLTSAIWLKNGLSPGDQKSAMTERSEAYKMAGLPDTGSSPDQRVIGTPLTPSAGGTAAASTAGSNANSAGLSAAAIAEAAGAQKASSSEGTSGTVTQTSVNSETTLQSAANSNVANSEAKPTSSGSSGFFGWGQSSGSEPAPAPAAPSSGSSFTQTVSNIPGNVSGFFSNMFGSGSSAPAPTPAPSPAPEAAPSAAVTTSSTAAVAPETSSWNSATTVSAHGQRDTLKPQNASFAPDSQPRAALTKGKFKIHIAAMRSKAEADALAQKLMAEHGAELGNHVPVVDSAVIGSMGTFYRVRIAGYSSDAEPRSLCNKLRSGGLDCLVVTN
jgi:hypothetical protein